MEELPRGITNKPLLLLLLLLLEFSNKTTSCVWTAYQKICKIINVEWT